jgi:apolipoprotein D and lipocalin family protein
MQSAIFTVAFFLSFIFLSTGSGCQKEKPENMDLSTVKELDLERYMGTWYEIARFDHSFERDLVGVTAYYELRPDGKITVINAGYKNSFEGKYKTAKGKAKQPNPNEPGKLKVAFFLFFYADYFILELDKDYQWVLIGSSSEKYLWILSRTPQPERETLDEILEKARERGYDTDKLIWVEQKEIITSKL